MTAENTSTEARHSLPQPRPRSAPPVIAQAATGRPILALSADEVAAIELHEDMDKSNRTVDFQECRS